MMEKISNKKRLMYMSGEDFYFFSYNIFLILKELNCFNGRTFKDYRKLPYLVDIISDKNLLGILVRNDFGEIRNPIDRKHLVKSYTDCQIKTSEYLKLLFSLERQGYVVLSSAKRMSQIDVELKRDVVGKEFFNTDIFGEEKNNITKLKSEISRISSINFETLIDRIYTAEREIRWAV